MSAEGIEMLEHLPKKWTGFLLIKCDKARNLRAPSDAIEPESALSDWKRTAMHEVSICEHLLTLLTQEARRHGVKKIVRLRLEIGRLSCLDPEALRFAFDAMAPDTIAEAAELQIDRPPVRAACEDCGAAVELNSRFEPCPSCGGTRLELRSGEEMRLLEMEGA